MARTSSGLAVGGMLSAQLQMQPHRTDSVNFIVRGYNTTSPSFGLQANPLIDFTGHFLRMVWCSDGAVSRPGFPRLIRGIGTEYRLRACAQYPGGGNGFGSCSIGRILVQFGEDGIEVVCHDVASVVHPDSECVADWFWVRLESDITIIHAPEKCVVQIVWMS